MRLRLSLGRLITKSAFTPVLCLIASIAYAGAWTQKASNILLINNFSYYINDRYFDNSGKKQHIPDYQKYEINPYIEYGLRDGLTIGANLFFQRVSQDNIAGSHTNSNIGIGDTELFIRKRLWQEDGWIFSAMPLIKLPSLESKYAQPNIGSNNYDMELTLSGGYGFKALNLNHFINIDASYRHRFGSPHDQLKLTTSAGISVSKNTMLLTQIFTTTRVNSNTNPLFTQSSGDDYDLTKLQISTIYKIDNKLSLQIGAFHNLDGRNIGNGNGFNFAVHKFF